MTEHLLRSASTLLCVFVAAFLLLHAAGGDPVDRLDSPEMTPEQVARTRRALGLDRPLPEQLARTAASYLRGDLGVSFTRRRPVTAAIGAALPASVALGAATVLVTYGAGLLAALGAGGLGARARSRLERIALVGATVPAFWLGVVLVLVFHGALGWLPASHAGPPGGGDGWARLRHLVLPTLTLALPATAVLLRYQLRLTEQARRAPYVLAARARGIGGARLHWRYVVRSTLGPTVALLALDLPVLVSGVLVVEVVFAWPGLGRLTAQAVLGGDYPLALGSIVLTTFAVVAARGLGGWAASRLDPRLRDTEVRP